MSAFYKFLFPMKPDGTAISLLLLALRLLFGGLLLSHGIQKWHFMPRLIITEGEIMLQEAMKTLEDAEAKAAEIVKEAGKKAEAIQAEAKEKANAMIVDANAGSKTDLAAIAVDQKKLETDLAEEALKEASDEIASLKKRVSEREGEAVELVIKQLL